MGKIRVTWVHVAEIEHTGVADIEDVRKALARHLDWEPNVAAAATEPELAKLAELHGDALDWVLSDVESDATEMYYVVKDRVVSSAHPIVEPDTAEEVAERKTA